MPKTDRRSPRPRTRGDAWAGGQEPFQHDQLVSERAERTTASASQLRVDLLKLADVPDGRGAGADEELGLEGTDVVDEDAAGAVGSGFAVAPRDGGCGVGGGHC